MGTPSESVEVLEGTTLDGVGRNVDSKAKLGDELILDEWMLVDDAGTWVDERLSSEKNNSEEIRTDSRSPFEEKDASTDSMEEGLGEASGV